MKSTVSLPALILSLSIMALTPRSAMAVESLGAGNSSLLGGDLTDPDDTLKPNEDCGSGSEEQLKPKNATWVRLTCAPANNKPNEIGHQVHPYQSWVGCPASAIFWNMPEDKKWYVGFKDGGYGGPTDTAPYYLAVQLRNAHILTHFTVTTSHDAPGRDPKTWAIQGSNTGRDGDWTDLYRCKANDRESSPFRVYPRNETMLFTSFTSADMAKSVSAENLKKLTAKLKGKELKKADFARPTKAYNWFRIAIFSCFNPNTTQVADPTLPPGFALGQLELFSASTSRTATGSAGPKVAGSKVTTKVAAKVVVPTVVAPTLLASLPAPGMGDLRWILPLDGAWDVEQGGLGAAPAQFTHTIAVPGLLDMATPPFPEVGVNSGRRQAFWYRKKFSVTGPIPDVAVLKVHKAMFGTQVTLNGKVLGEHPLNFTPGLFDAHSALRVGENELLVRVGASPANVAKPIQWGYDDEKRLYIPGIYDSVELILSGSPQILRVQAVPDIDNKVVTVHAWVRDARGAKGTRLHFTVREVSTGHVAGEADCVVAAGRGPERTGMAILRVNGCHLWSPEDPFLYELEARGEADVLKTRFGMRSFTFDRDTGFAVLNGKTYFMRGTNVTLFRFFEDSQRGDKPWREAWVRQLFKAYKDMHWNSLRFSICQPPEKWYQIADEVGMLVQDEYPIWKMYPAAGDFDGDELTQEYTEWMQERWNHPCVVIWDACNETPSLETGKAIRKVRGLDFSDRPWDNGMALPDRPGDVYEAHDYHYKDPQFKPHYLGRVPKTPKGNAYRNKDKNPIVVNEYGWLWLNRDGSPTTLTAELYGNLLPNASPAQRLRLYAKLLAAETEFWRHSRECAALLHFCALGYSRPGGQTSDHWADVEKLTWEPEFYTYVRDAFAPVGVMLDAYEPEYQAGAVQQFPVSVINDLYDPWEGTVRLRVLRDGNTVEEKVQSCKVPGLGGTRLNFTINLPAELADYQLEAALIKPGTDPVRSVRDFKTATTVKTH